MPIVTTTAIDPLSAANVRAMTIVVQAVLEYGAAPTALPLRRAATDADVTRAMGLPMSAPARSAVESLVRRAADRGPGACGRRVEGLPAWADHRRQADHRGRA